MEVPAQMLARILVAGSRVSLRLLREYLATQVNAGRRIVIVGADRAGVLLARVLRDDASYGLRLVGFVDGDACERGTIVYGLPVLGPLPDLAEVIKRYRVEEVLVSMPESALTDRVFAASSGRGVKFKTLEIVLRSRDGVLRMRIWAANQ